MELWISQEQQKINKFNKKLFPGILLEAVLLTLVFGVGTDERSCACHVCRFDRRKHSALASA